MNIKYGTRKRISRTKLFNKTIDRSNFETTRNVSRSTNRFTNKRKIKMNFLPYLTFILFLFTVKGQEEFCEINACEALMQSEMKLKEFSDDLEKDGSQNYLIKLERRVRSLEQPGMYLSIKINIFGLFLISLASDPHPAFLSYS